MYSFFHELGEALGNVSDKQREDALKIIRSARRLVFIGNGGSAAIASHMAIDFTKNGGIEAVAFNDPAALTCIANDYGYEYVFSKQLELYHKDGDALIAISSSGESQNIINGVAEARILHIPVVTLTGFSENNQLRYMGDVNFWVDSGDYGVVEISHLAIIHSMIGFHG